MKKFLNKIIIILAALTFLPVFLQATTNIMTDVSVHNFKVEENSPTGAFRFSFNIVNKEDKAIHNLKYGISLKDKDNKVLGKYIYTDFIDVPSHKTIKKSFIQKIDKAGVKKIILFVSNENGFPIANSLLSNLHLTINHKDLTETEDYSDEIKLFNCNIEKSSSDTSNLVCESKQGQIQKILIDKMSIYKNNIFGVLVKNISVKSRNTQNGQILFEIPQLDPGYYEIKSKIGNQTFFNKIIIDGNFINIYNVKTDKISYKKNENARVFITWAAKGDNLNFVIGIKDKDNKNCGIKETSGLKDNIEISIQKDCQYAKVFISQKKKNGNIVSIYNTPGVDFDLEQENQEFDISTYFMNFKQYNFYIYGILFILLILIIILFFMRKYTAAVSSLVLLVFILFGYFILNRVYAVQYAASGNVYNVDFSKNIYKSTDNVSFSLGVRNLTSMQKEKDTSVAVSVDGNPFFEVVGVDDTESVYQIGLGKMSQGQHNVTVRGLIQPRFSISWFDKARFGLDTNDHKFYITVDDNADWCAPGEDPSSGCKDPSTCIVTTVSPKADEVCKGVFFQQTSNCPTEGEVKVGTKTTGECAVTECESSSWSRPTSYYCAGESFTQTSNCGETRQAVGTDPSPGCRHVPAADFLECSTGGINWDRCDSKIFKILPVDRLYIRVASQPTSVQAWSLIDSAGGVKPFYEVEKGNNTERVNVKFKFDGNGINGKKQFYNFGVKAIGFTPDFTVVKLKVISPDRVEI